MSSTCATRSWLRASSNEFRSTSSSATSSPWCVMRCGSAATSASIARIRSAKTQPEVVLHLAAQALVRAGYVEPVGTFATNVMGTVHLLEAARQVPSVRAVVVVTTDKCYENPENGREFRESDRLGGHGP